MPRLIFSNANIGIGDFNRPIIEVDYFNEPKKWTDWVTRFSIAHPSLHLPLLNSYLVEEGKYVDVELLDAGTSLKLRGRFDQARDDWMGEVTFIWHRCEWREHGEPILGVDLSQRRFVYLGQHLIS